MEIPFASADTVFRSYKIMPRSEVLQLLHSPWFVYRTCNFSFPQNAHAYVNAAFVMQFNSSTSTVTGEPTLVFGGIQAHDVSTRSIN